MDGVVVRIKLPPRSGSPEQFLSGRSVSVAVQGDGSRDGWS